jgi:hypothetical protein
MVESKATATATVEVKVKTEAELMAELQSALKSGDFKSVAKVSTEIAKVQKSKEQAELEAKQKILEAKTGGVKAMLDSIIGMMTAGHKPGKNVIDKLVETLNQQTGKELDAADGVWYVNDFGDKLTTCRLMKAQVKAKTGGGGGGGKKFDINTVELINGKYANEPYKDTGKSFKEAWESNSDKNWRYAIRQEVLKREGLIK